MKLSDYLFIHGIDQNKLEPVIGQAVRDQYPMIKNLTDYKAIRWVNFLDLEEKDLNNLIIRIAKYTRLWIFS